VTDRQLSDVRRSAPAWHFVRPCWSCCFRFGGGAGPVGAELSTTLKEDGHMAMNNRVTIAPTGSTGTARSSGASNLAEARRMAIEFIIEAVGGTPTITFTIQGSMDGGTSWTDLAYVTQDATVASSKAGIVQTAVGTYTYFLDGLDKRFFDMIAIKPSANTNVTYRANAIPVAGSGF
jgi:hypothetical protein